MHMLMGGVACAESQATLWSGLTWNVDTGAKVIVSPGWWPDSNVSPTRFRTNQTAASMIVKVSGCSAIGVKSAGTGCSSSGVRLGLIAARKSTTELGLFSSTAWTYGIPLNQNPQGSWLYTNLDPATTYFIQFVTTMPPDYPAGDGTFETHVQSGDAGVGATYGFIDITGFIASPGTTFNTITWANTRKKFYILGDSNCEGRLATEAGTTNYSTKTGSNFTEHRALFFTGAIGAGTQDWDVRGVTGQWFWTMIHSKCNGANYIPVIMNNSAGGMWQTKMSAAQRTYWAGLWPGVYKDFETRFKWRTNFVNTDFTAVGDWTGGWSPNCVIITSGYNNYIQGWWETPGGKGSGSVEFSTNQKANLGSTTAGLIKSIRDQWAAVPIFVAFAQATDAIWDNAPVVGGPWGLTAFAQFNAGVNNLAGSFYHFAATGADYVANTGRFYDFSSLIGTAGIANTWDVLNASGTGQPHMNATQHEACRSAAQSTFNALAI